jgi:hypothetical protein
MGVDSWGLEESIAQLSAEKKREEERRKEESRKEDERWKEEERVAEERRIADAKAKEEAERDMPKKDKKAEPRRVVFQRSVSPPLSPTIRADGSNPTPPSPGRARLASSAMNVQVFYPHPSPLPSPLSSCFWPLLP